MLLQSHLLERLLTGEKSSSLRFLLVWRLFIVFPAFAALFIWSRYFQGDLLWAGLITLFVAYISWTACVLYFERLQGIPHAEFRELWIDLLWVFALVWMSGRSENPFLYYSFVVVAFSAVVLRARQAWVLCLASIMSYSLLIAVDVSQHFAHFPSNYKTHLVGMWLNFILSSSVICFFVSFLVMALRRKETTITSYREKNLKNEQLIGLATVAASAVHNLATPLSTLKLYLEEFSDAEQSDKQKVQDVQQMSIQLQRCQSTIDELSLLAKRSDEKNRLAVKQLIDALQEHYALMYPEARLKFVYKTEMDTYLSCTPLLHYALVNLINNALESAIDSVAVTVDVQQGHVVIQIKNATSVDSEALMASWGQPSESKKENGLGIGSLLANTTIEQHSGRVELETSFSENLDSSADVRITVYLPIVDELA